MLKKDTVAKAISSGTRRSDGEWRTYRKSRRVQHAATGHLCGLLIIFAQQLVEVMKVRHPVDALTPELAQLRTQARLCHARPLRTKALVPHRLRFATWVGRCRACRRSYAGAPLAAHLAPATRRWAGPCCAFGRADGPPTVVCATTCRRMPSGPLHGGTVDPACAEPRRRPALRCVSAPGSLRRCGRGA